MTEQNEVEPTMDPQVAVILRSLTPEEIDMLRDAFIYLDRDSDGFISLEELVEGVKEMVNEERFGPLQEYLAPLFTVADKDRDEKLSLTEFLMSFGDGPGVVPADVINSCVATVRVRLSDEEVSALQDNFRSFDKDEDGFLNREELENALRAAICDKFPDLTEANFDEIITVVLKSADRNGDGKLSLSEFIRSYQEDQGVLPAAFVDVGATKGVREISVDELNVLREAFAVLDKNNDGFIDVADLYQALWEMLGSQVHDKSQITDLCDMIVTTAGRGKSGNVNLEDFVRGFLQNMSILEIPLIAVKASLQSAAESLEQMLGEGKLDHLLVALEGNEMIDYENMVQLLSELYKDAFPEWEAEILTNVMTAIVYGAEVRNSGRLSLDDFIRSFVEGPGMISLEVTGALSFLDGSTGRPYTATDDDLVRISEALRTLSDDTDDDGCITLDSLRNAIFETFSESEAAAQCRLEYVLANFVNQLEDGRLGWNENVQIIEERAGDEERDDEEDRNEADEGDGEEDGEDDEGLPIMTDQAGGDAASSSQDAQDLPSKDDEATPPPAAAAAAAPVEADDEKKEESVEEEEEVRRTPAGHPEVKVTQVDLQQVSSARSKASTEDAAASADEPAEDADVNTLHDSSPKPSPASHIALPSMAGAVGYGREKPSVTHNFAVARLDARSKEVKVASIRPHMEMARDAIYDNELRELFSLYDTKNCGYLVRQEFKKVYANMEHYGLEPSSSEIDALFKRYSHGSDKLHFNEFCVLMLQRFRM